MENQPVPTTAEYVKALESMTSLEPITCPDPEGCPICKEPMDTEHKAVKTKCGHVFGMTCLREWLLWTPYPSKTCPVCRQEIARDPYDPSDDRNVGEDHVEDNFDPDALPDLDEADFDLTDLQSGIREALRWRIGHVELFGCYIIIPVDFGWEQLSEEQLQVLVDELTRYFLRDLRNFNPPDNMPPLVLGPWVVDVERVMRFRRTLSNPEENNNVEEGWGILPEHYPDEGADGLSSGGNIDNESAPESEERDPMATLVEELAQGMHLEGYLKLSREIEKENAEFEGSPEWSWDDLERRENERPALDPEVRELFYENLGIQDQFRIIENAIDMRQSMCELEQDELRRLASLEKELLPSGRPEDLLRLYEAEKTVQWCQQCRQDQEQRFNMAWHEILSLLEGYPGDWIR